LGLPVRPKSAPLAESGYRSYPWTPIQQLKRRGYKTIFLYGGDLSWRNVGQFAKAQGFDEVYGKASFETNSSSFHTWGVFDEVVYKYAEEILKKNRNERMFLFILTTNNHPPYELPDWYSAPVMVIPEEMKIKGDKHLAQKRFQSFRYAMDSLGKFLKRVQNEKNMVVVTADNNTIEGIVEFGSLLESKNIPLYIYTPFKSKLCIDAYGSHKDIFPTIFHLLFSEMEYFSVGENICDLGIGFNGDSIVFSSDGVKKVDLFSKDGDDLDWYYRSSIYITDYLIRNGEL
jgi:phosphoglycerol transferase MdoB-like AlkP superfamily enzyme